MTAQISHLTIDCTDAYALSVWWGEVLGMSEDPRDPNEQGDEECMIFSADGRTRLLFIATGDAKLGKNRLHLDLQPATGSGDAEVERVLGLAATLLDDRRQPDGTGWAVLGDPEGNEFCVLRGPAERDDPVRPPAPLDSPGPRPGEDLAGVRAAD